MGAVGEPLAGNVTLSVDPDDMERLPLMMVGDVMITVDPGETTTVELMTQPLGPHTALTGAGGTHRVTGGATGDAATVAGEPCDVGDAAEAGADPSSGDPLFTGGGNVGGLPGWVVGAGPVSQKLLVVHVLPGM